MFRIWDTYIKAKRSPTFRPRYVIKVMLPCVHFNGSVILPTRTLMHCHDTRRDSVVCCTTIDSVVTNNKDYGKAICGAWRFAVFDSI